MNYIKTMFEGMRLAVLAISLLIKGAMMGAFVLAILVIMSLDANTVTFGDLIRLLQMPGNFQLIALCGVFNLGIKFMIWAFEVSAILNQAKISARETHDQPRSLT